MGTLTSALKNCLRNFRRTIRAPKLPKEQPHSGPSQPSSQLPRAEAGNHSQATATATAISIPQATTEPGAKPAPVIQGSGASTSINPTPNPTTTRPAPTKMASDEDYAAFLEKANADPNEGYAAPQQKSSGRVGLKAVDEGVEVPKELRSAVKDRLYVSDADEPFEVVCLKLKGKEELPDEATFAELVQHPDPSQADVEIMDVAHWDVQGEYAELVNATREATRGSDVIVYRIKREGARVEYWLVGIEGGRLVGVKALAVES